MAHATTTLKIAAHTLPQEQLVEWIRDCHILCYGAETRGDAEHSYPRLPHRHSIPREERDRIAAMPKAFEYHDVPRADLASAIRCCLYWIEELVEEGASDERIEEVVELMRPLFEEYQQRMSN